MRAVFHLFAAIFFTPILGHAGYAAEFKEADVGLWIASQGGTVERDAAGRTTAVNLRATWITDTDLTRLAGLPRLTRLDLSNTAITDLGMERLAPTVEEWNLHSEPWTFVVDGEGIVRARFEGVMTRRELEAALQQVLLAK